MQISKKWLKSRNACQEGMKFVEEKKLIGLEGVEFIRKLMEYEQYEYSNWLIVRIMDREQCVKYANFSADLAKKYATRAAYWASSATRAADCATRAESAYWAASADCAYWAARAAYCAESATYCAERAAYCAANVEMAAYKEILSFGLKLLEGVE